MGLPIRIEDRTGDTSYTQRRRQRADPPPSCATTPDLALLTSYEDAAVFRCRPDHHRRGARAG